MFLILLRHPHQICWGYVRDIDRFISLSFTAMCTCMWSVKTSTLHVWRTKNTGTPSQQIISLSLKVRELGCLWRLQFHSVALLSFCCKLVFTNPPPLALFSDIIQMVETNGKVAIKDGASELLNLPLRCHVCRKELPTIPALKEHIKCHFSSWDSVSRMEVEFSVDLCWVRHFCLFFCLSSFEKKKKDMGFVNCTGWVSIVFDSFVWLFKMWRFSLWNNASVGLNTLNVCYKMFTKNRIVMFFHLLV